MPPDDRRAGRPAPADEAQSDRRASGADRGDHPTDPGLEAAVAGRGGASRRPAGRPVAGRGPRRPPGGAEGPGRPDPRSAASPGSGPRPPVSGPPVDVAGPSARPWTDNGWSADPTTAEPVAAPVAEAAAYRSQPPRARTRHAQRSTREVRRGRRVHRIVRRIELWSVLKISLFLYLCLYVAVLIALAVIWGLAYSTGSVDKVQSFLADVGLDNFRFYGDQMFRACAAIGGVLVLAATLVTVVTVALVNLISELTGGIRLTVIEEDVDDRPGPSGRGVPTGDGGNGARTRSSPTGGRVRRPVPTGSGPSDRVAPRGPDPLRSSDAPGL